MITLLGYRLRSFFKSFKNKEFEEATRELALTAEKQSKSEQKVLGDSVVKNIRGRLKAMNIMFATVDSLPVNAEAYSIYIKDREDEDEDFTTEVIVHIDFHNKPFPIVVRGLYAGGLLGEEEPFAKDEESVAIMIHLICHRIKASGYLLKTPVRSNFSGKYFQSLDL